MGVAWSFKVDLTQKSGFVQKDAIDATLHVVLAVLECAGLQKCHSKVSH